MWRKTADALRETAVSDAGTQSDGRGVNKNGAPLLGDTRDLFRPKTSDIPAQPGVYKWRDGEGRVIYVGKAKNLRNRLTNYFQPLYQLHPRTQTMVLTARSLEWTVVGKIHFFTRERRMFHDAFHASSTHAPHVLHTRSARKRGGATLAIISLASHRPLRCVAWPSAVTSGHHVSPHHGRTDRHAFGTEPSWEWSKTGLLSASYL